MTYVALVTDQFADVAAFYGEKLRFPVVDRWDRSNARGIVFDLDGMRLEVLDNAREQKPLRVGPPSGRINIVIEVADIDAARQRIDIPAPVVQSTSWGARLFQVQDPDGVPVVFLQWVDKPVRLETFRGYLETGIGRGQVFTRIEWARRQFVDKLDIDPFPGTANLRIVEPESISIWQRISAREGIRIENPDEGPNACDARCYPVRINGWLDAAIVVPEIPEYLPERVELIASVNIRGAMGVRDGDSLVVESKFT